MAVKRVEVQNITIRQGCLYSKGIGLDDNGDFIHFIGHTCEMMNIQNDLYDFEENPEHGRPRIYLHHWQERRV